MEVDENDAITTEYNGEILYFCSEGCRDKFFHKSIHKIPRATYDLIIIGGGPAGLTAAVYAATLKIDAFLITKDLGGQAIDSTKIENYMGYDFITGPELVKRFQHQLIHSHYIDHMIAQVEKVKPLEEGFEVITSDLKKYTSRALIIATGMTRRRLKIPGEEEFQRRGIFYGNIQDLSFVQGKDVVVIGGGNSAAQIVENLRTVAKNIYLVSDFVLKADPSIIERIKNFRNLKIYEGYIPVEFQGDKTVSSVLIRKRATNEIIKLPAHGVFIAIGLQPNSSLVADLCRLNEKGEIIINYDCSTSYPGIFAAGDVTNAFGKRIIIASGEGAKAALAVRQYLLDLRKQRVKTKY